MSAPRHPFRRHTLASLAIVIIAVAAAISACVGVAYASFEDELRPGLREAQTVGRSSPRSPTGVQVGCRSRAARVDALSPRCRRKIELT